MNALRFGSRSVVRSLALAATLAASALLPVAAAAQEDPNVQHGFRPEKVYAFGEVDQVNLFNGNLMLSIPIGGSYGVNGGFSYGLVLTYNSKLWEIYGRSDLNNTYQFAEPYKYSNAGFGWRLSLGELEGSSTSATYIGPDGGQHTFYDSPRVGGTATAGYRYTRDGSYLRLHEQSSTSWQVQFPDGTKHTFTRATTLAPWRLSNILDPYSHYLSVTYPTTNRWQLHDGQRTHYVDFATLSNGAKVVWKIDLAAFGGARAVYELTHVVKDVQEPCHPVDTDPMTEPFRSIGLLTQIKLPDSSTWRMDGLDDYYLSCSDGTSTINQLPGSLKRITLPTLGKIEWTYQDYSFPARQPGLPGEWLGGSITPGVKTKRVLNAAGTCETWDGVGCQWTYTPSNGIAAARSTRVTYPTNDESVFWFNQSVPLSTTTWNGWQYGLPIHPSTGDGTGLWLSQEIYDGAAASGVKKRSVYLRYEHDRLPTSTTDPDPWYNSNRRVASEKTVFHDDAGRYAQSTRSNFDGVGNYRQTNLAGSFGAGDTRSSFTNTNPARGTYVLDPATNSTAGSINFSQWPTGTNWVLGTSKDASTSEAGVTAKTDFCFEGEGTTLMRPFLLRKRTMAGAAPGASDLITTFVRDGSGNVIEERTYGGDKQAVGTTADLCALVLPASDAYQVRHTYAAGSRATSQWFNSGGTAFGGFKSLDLTIDTASGLPSSRRDVSGVHTDLVFDTMGRLTWEKPTAGNGAWTQYAYVRATSSSAMANVHVIQRPNGSTTGSLAESRVYFDAFGRVWRDQKLGAAGTWSTVDSVYNAMGWRRSTTERMTGSPTKLTIFKGFDPFGRPTTIQPPDGTAHNVTLSYLGTRQVSRTVKVKTSTTGETNAITTERYDRQGRLYQVVEPSGAAGANTTTSYGYDVGGRLVSVSMPLQSRTFSYDNRGFLAWERHPEKGTSGNGYVRYLEYDALGNVGRKLDAVATASATTGAAIDVRFTYDRAARLTRVDEATGSQRVLKSFLYATANSGANRLQGKLQTADRYNYLSIGTTPYTVLMRETYNYSGLGGRVSNRDLQSYVNGTAGESFTQGWAYNDLGDVSSLTYPRCTWATCNGGSVMSPTIGFTFTRGWLTAVPGYANPITYHANGMVNQVTHANNVTWTQALDPNAMRRPASYSTSGAATNWSSGTYAYDGAGNVAAIGSNGYVYDPVSRLTSATQWTGATTPGTGSITSQSAAYDPYGNITSLTTNGAAVTTATSTSTNRLTGATYDSAGSMTSWNLNTYVYEPLGMTSTITASGVSTYHLYTADDERVWTFQPGAPSRWTIRDLDGKVLRELKNNAGTWFVEKDYVYRDGALLAAATATEILHYHPDHLGSPRLITGLNGVFKSYHLYHPYGAEATYFAQDTERLKFTAHERDLGNLASAADDIDYMHARYYQPQVGRFLGVDPVLGRSPSPQSWNRYAYVAGNPMRNIDPTGQITGSAMADAVEGPMRELKEELMFGLTDGTAFGIVASTLSGAVMDAGLAVVDVLRVGESSGEAIGSEAGAWDTTVAIGKDVVRAAAIAAPAAGAGRAVVGRAAAGKAASAVAGTKASSAAQGALLRRSLASRQQLAELGPGARMIAGPGTPSALRDAPRLASQYGGKAGDWVKISSSTYRATDGTGARFSTHAYMNVRTGQVVEPKTVLGR